MSKDFVYLDSDTLIENQIELGDFDITNIRFITNSISDKNKESHTYYIKNGIIYDKKNIFEFNGSLKMEANVENKDFFCFFCFIGYFIDGKLCDPIKILNFTMNFKRQKCLFDIVRLTIEKINARFRKNKNRI